jgi:alkylation response protein AidB-like acyl-CoA dehydrogenase
MTDTALQPTDPLLEELDDWLAANWDPDHTVGEWWERLGLAGWSAPSLPADAFGRGLSRSDAVRVQQRIAELGALGAPAGLGLLLAAPTIAAHGTRRQVETHVADIVTGRRSWCQLFSEPSAGSDLAGLQSRAVRDGDEWVVNGQKVWTSSAQRADFGMLLARTDPDAPKHRGLTYFALPMRQPGVEIRPLREMTGRSLFNEVFLTDARVAHDAVIGTEGQGWAVANTTLMNERAGLGSGGGSAAGGLALPGSVAGDLHRRAGDLVPPGAGSDARPGGAGGLALRAGAGMLIELARRTGKSADPTVRQDLARLYTLGELGRFNAVRLKAAKERGGDIPGLPNVAKLSMSQMMVLARDLGLRIAGPAGMLHAYDEGDRPALRSLPGRGLVAAVTETALLSPAPSIYGGTDQIQRNIIGERVLGLPKEPGHDRAVPFSELPKNV